MQAQWGIFLGIFLVKVYIVKPQLDILGITVVIR